MFWILAIFALAAIIGAVLVPRIRRQEELKIQADIALEESALAILTALETLDPAEALLALGVHREQGDFPSYIGPTMLVGEAIGAIETVINARSSAAAATGMTSKGYPQEHALAP